jgi:hypothetical protein
MQPHVIEILYTARCRHVSAAVERVRDVIARTSSRDDIEIRLVLVDTFAEAVDRGFRGSPSVRIDGEDVDSRNAAGPVGLFGRGYVVGRSIERAPSAVAIASALDAARGRQAVLEGMRRARAR